MLDFDVRRPITAIGAGTTLAEVDVDAASTRQSQQRCCRAQDAVWEAVTDAGLTLHLLAELIVEVNSVEIVACANSIDGRSLFLLLLRRFCLRDR